LKEHPLRVAVIGSNFTVRAQVPGFMAYSETNVVALASDDKIRAQMLASQFGVRAVYGDYRRLLEEVQPDLVHVLVPPNERYEVTRAAIEAGAHVICEVPVAPSVEQTRELLAAAEAARRVHVANLAARYLPGYYYQRVLNEQGYVGKAIMIEAAHYCPSMRLVDDWDWRSDAARGGGVLNAYAPRYIDAFSMVGGEVMSVVCTTDTFVQNRFLPASMQQGDVTAEDTVWLSLELAGGQRATLSISAVLSGVHQRFALYGDSGVLVLEDDSGLYGTQQGWRLSQIAVPMEYRPPVWDSTDVLLGPFVRLVQLTVDAVRYGDSKMPTFKDSLRIQRVLGAARQSDQTGRRVALSGEVM
jgi:predicted dehydrogenase